MTFLGGFLSALAAIAAFRFARERFLEWRVRAMVRAYRQRQIDEAEEIRRIREDMLRLMPEVTQVPWGFSFMGTGLENTETNSNLGEVYKGPITGRLN